MNEREPWDDVEASLRREFSPPSLDALHERISEAAAEVVSEEAPSTMTAVAAAKGKRGTSARWRAPMFVAMAVAAALALVWALGSRVVALPGNDVDSPRHPSEEPMGPIAAASRRAAGAELDEFLVRGAVLPTSEVNCAEPQPPPNCNDDREVPHLIASADLQLLGECDISEGIDCARHDLPAQRALLVHLGTHDENVIVCIEPPWADPRPLLPPDSRFNIFRRTLGDYVLYEVTPLPQAVALDHIVLAVGG